MQHTHLLPIQPHHNDNLKWIIRYVLSSPLHHGTSSDFRGMNGQDARRIPFTKKVNHKFLRRLAFDIISVEDSK